MLRVLRKRQLVIYHDVWSFTKEIWVKGHFKSSYYGNAFPPHHTPWLKGLPWSFSSRRAMKLLFLACVATATFLPSPMLTTPIDMFMNFDLVHMWEVSVRFRSGHETWKAETGGWCDTCRGWVAHSKQIKFPLPAEQSNPTVVNLSTLYTFRVAMYQRTAI